MIRQPIQQPDGEARPHNDAVANIVQNRPITSEGNVHSRGSSKVVSQWGAFGSKKRTENLLTFWPTVSGNKCTVSGGWWKIDGAGEWWVDATTLTLTGATAYPYVRKMSFSVPGNYILGEWSATGPTVDIGFANVRPPATDGVYDYRILCRCVASRISYSITERNHPGGDIIQSAPLL